MDQQMQEAVENYVAKRPQLGPRGAAAQTCQTFGVSILDLAAAVCESGKLLTQERA